MCDYLLWFSKEKSKIKFKRLFTEKKIPTEDANFRFIELTNGERRVMTREERADISILPKDVKIYRHSDITSPGKSSYDNSFEFEEETFNPGTRHHWKTTLEGMRTLKNAKRIAKYGTKLSQIKYFDDFPFITIDNIWNDTGTGGFGDKRYYVVQTTVKTVTRCLLMTTDPGDLVLDPTCGSGTTAYVAEKWGRRWITCDTSRVAITLAKQRLMTAYFDYYQLRDEKQGINSGFKYKEVPHITLKDIANNPDIKEDMNKKEIEEAIARHALKEPLFNQPCVDNNKFRVSGPFTMEAVPAVKVETLSGKTLNGAENYARQDWFYALKEYGIKGKKGLSKDIEFTRLEIINDTHYIYAEGETKEDGRRTIVCFGSEYAPLEQRQIEEALKEAKPFHPDLVIFCAFQFDPEASKDVDELDIKWTRVLKVQMNSDLFTDDLKKETKGDSFWLIGQPDVSVEKIKEGEDKGKYTVSVQGFDYYDTKTNKIESGGKDKIAMWMLDSNYDDRSLYPRQVFFPLTGNKDGWSPLKKSLKSEINEELIDRFQSTISIPFKVENYKKIAVKIIDDRGIESFVIKDLK